MYIYLNTTSTNSKLSLWVFSFRGGNYIYVLPTKFICVYILNNNTLGILVTYLGVCPSLGSNSASQRKTTHNHYPGNTKHSGNTVGTG